MSYWNRFVRSDLVIKLRNWEYWPFGIIQLPVFVYYIWLSLRARSLIFFSASNPGIAMGGLFGESKYDVLRKVPSQYTPKTFLVTTPTTADEVIRLLPQYGLTFPVIFKPDVGERGYRVARVSSNADVHDYVASAKGDFLVQEFVGLPLEFGIFYTRYPEEKSGKVTSIVMKEMLTVTGDGKSTLQSLILHLDRAKLQWNSLNVTYRNRLHEILPAGQPLELVSIGNHCLGTKFLDGNHLINVRLSETFDSISQQVEGFYFGRFDLRCKSLNDLYDGNVMIMELNGCGAEPAHIYQPGYSLPSAIKVLIIHWRDIFVIARENVSRGAAYTPFGEAFRYYKKFKAALR
jgi:hypothetical protein